MEALYSGAFAAAGWHAEDWLLVKSPRWDSVGEWVQEADHIRNRVPADVTPEQMLGERAGETYTSMLYKEPQTSLRVCAEMSFDERMAPLIVLAAEPELGADGRREYREHIEIVLFDEGINIWHHKWSVERGPHWRRAAWASFAVDAGRRYALEVERVEMALTVRCGECVFGVEIALPEQLYTGITGCEGNNRFYEFVLFARED
ncbi:MAG: hypothetical protein ACI906_000443 [Candidatus Latescibacterota bacterium]|jgi:hypothetical protein